ncbi:response regulator [Desulfovibrio inopinatus]|uniref:response regulator n=1 Tax=Desulfovibrio inopinatus TaxID=102109 RepID=UPI000412E421|nr:response regulator [Desulfovibrio inopinatus]
MRPLRVLVVDDEAAFRSTLIKRLKRRGVDVIDAPNGLEALSRLAEERVDVVVLDMKMPGMDGMETLECIKKSHEDIEIVLLTGHADIEAANQAMSGGAFDYMLKPISIDELLHVIEEAGKRASQHRQDNSLEKGIPRSATTI